MIVNLVCNKSKMIVKMILKKNLFKLNYLKLTVWILFQQNILNRLGNHFFFFFQTYLHPLSVHLHEIQGYF